MLYFYDKRAYMVYQFVEKVILFFIIYIIFFNIHITFTNRDITLNKKKGKNKMERFSSLKELEQYEAYYKRHREKIDQMRIAINIDPKVQEILSKKEKTKDKIIFRELEKERERLTEKYIDEEVERRLKEQIEKEILPVAEKTIEQALKNLNLE